MRFVNPERIEVLNEFGSGLLFMMWQALRAESAIVEAHRPAGVPHDSRGNTGLEQFCPSEMYRLIQAALEKNLSGDKIEMMRAT